MKTTNIKIGVMTAVMKKQMAVSLATLLMPDMLFFSATSANDRTCHWCSDGRPFSLWENDRMRG